MTSKCNIFIPGSGLNSCVTRHMITQNKYLQIVLELKTSSSLVYSLVLRW